MKYVLMNKDREVLSFETKHTETGKTLVVDEQIINKALLPYDYAGKIKGYINNRKAPKHRKHIAQLLQELGAENIEGYIRLCNAASLVDSFWIRDESKPLNWSDVSLFSNEFDENIARIALDGGNASVSSTSPEFSVNGTYAKCWVRENDEIFLLKRGSDTYKGREISAEYYASQIVKEICKNSVTYDMVEYHEKSASKCRIFTSEDTGFSQITNFYNHKFGTEASDFLEVCEKCNAGDDYRRMVVADALILNIDRHLGNFGFIINNDTMEIKGMAPNFDFNRSMLFNLTDKQFIEENIDDITAMPFTEGTFVENAKEMMTNEIRNDLINLKGFKFQRSELSPWSDERVAKYEVFVEQQINRILGE